MYRVLLIALIVLAGSWAVADSGATVRRDGHLTAATPPSAAESPSRGGQKQPPQTVNRRVGCP